MTALPVSQSDHVCPKEKANAWLADHYAELRSRAGACFSYGDPESREEAIGEVLAIVTSSVHSTARRGALNNLTPHWSVVYAVRQFASGRRAVGYSSTDAMAEATRRKHGVCVLSLDRDLNVNDPDSMRLGDVLADRRAEDPAEVVRRDHDYERIFEVEGINAKGRRTFEYLAETHGAGKQAELAAELMISPGRITQIKGEVAEALARHGYAGPLGARPAVQ